jgi:hypothetical protein
LYVPLNYNDGPPDYGREIEPAKLNQTKEELAKRLGGVTVLQATGSLEGNWVSPEGQLVQDKIMILRVVVNSDLDPWFAEYSLTVKERFRQLKILIFRSEGYTL